MATDYNNSFKKRQQQLDAARKSMNEQKGPSKGDGYLSGIIKTAVKKAYNTIVKPTALKFIDQVFEDTKNEILWKDKSKPSDGFTNYRLQSTIGSFTLPYVQVPSIAAGNLNVNRYKELRKPTENEAIAVLNNMYGQLRKTGRVSLGFYMREFGEKTTYIDEQWGWTNMSGADAEWTTRGYRLVLPELEVLSA